MNTHHEENILTFSACGALFFAILALVWGILAKSQMIMFDGIYSFISLVMTGIYFYAAKSITRGSDENFPYGRAAIEPIVVVVQSLVLLAICMKAFGYAAISLFSGGREINNVSGMGYAAIGVVGCFISWYYITRTGRKKAPDSDLIKTQGSQWLMDTLLSFAVLVGFFIGFLLQRAGYEQYAKYMDPLMVITAVLFFARYPIVSLVGGIKGMMIMAPDKSVWRASKDAIKEIAEKRGFDDIILRVGKTGRELVIEVSFVSEDPNQARPVNEMDAIHKEVETRLKNLFNSSLWLSVSFVHDRKLA